MDLYEGVHIFRCSIISLHDKLRKGKVNVVSSGSNLWVF